MDPVTVIGNYQIESTIARGGMATVYRARDTRDGRAVALKQIHPHILGDGEFSQRFLHEARMHEQLKHPNILEIFEAGEAAGSYFIALELIVGGTLESLTRRIGKFPPELALYVIHGVLSGLAHAHAKGITHRDIKPSNVMFSMDGTIKVADFGISKRDDLTRLTQTGEILGTPAYMSPEQASGTAVDSRSDLFSTGVVLYEMLIGFNPFATDNPLTTITKIVDFQPEGLFDLDSSIPIEYEALVRRMLMKDRAGRFASAEEAAGQVRASLAPLDPAGLATTMREFLKEPEAWVERSTNREAEKHFTRALELYKGGKGSAEGALWELHQTMSFKRDHAEAQQLFSTISTQSGFTGGKQSSAENPKIRELEERLRQDPDNLPALLQLAKLYKLEQDIVAVIKLYLRLKRVAPDDPYTRAQVEGLVPGGDSTLIDVRRQVPAPRPRPARRAVALPPPRAKSSAGLWIGGGALLALAIGAVVFMTQQSSPPAGTPADSADAKQAAVERIRSFLGLEEPEAVQIDTSDSVAGRLLEQAEEARASADNRKAIEAYERFLAQFPEHGERLKVLLAVGSLYEAIGKADQAEARYAEVMQSASGSLALEAQLRSGALKEKLGQDVNAILDFRTVAQAEDVQISPRAHFLLGKLYENQQQDFMAVHEYETIAQRYAESPQMLAAQARLAPLYEKNQDTLRAREAYEYVAANSPVGGAQAKAARAALARLAAGAEEPRHAADDEESAPGAFDEGARDLGLEGSAAAPSEEPAASEPSPEGPGARSSDLEANEEPREETLADTTEVILSR